MNPTLKTDPNGMIRTGQYSTVNPQFLSTQGLLQAQSFAGIPSTIPATTIGSVSPVNLPTLTGSNPSSTNNLVSSNNLGLASSLSSLGYSLDNNGQFVYTPPKTDATSTDTGSSDRWNSMKQLLGMVPKQENVLSSQEMLQQQALIDQKQKDVGNLTASLNAIVAKQNADLLSINEQGKVGNQATLEGRDSAQINKEAAIKSLPLQAQIAAAQGDLGLAQQHYDTLFKIKSEDVTNTYNYQKNVYDAISGFVSGEQKIQLDQKIKENDRAYAEKQDFLKNQNEILKSATEAGAPTSVISAINSATTTQEALTAAGQYSGGLDAIYKREQIKTEQAQRMKLQTEITQLNNPSSEKEVLTDPNSASILAQTGLSIPAFAFLTQGTPALTRMTAAQRLQYMNEAENWANTKGIDISTFRSQYTALGKTVEANVLRNNQAKVAESEIDATLTNLREAATASGLKTLKVDNVIKLFAGKQFNDDNVTRYAFHLNQLRNEMAMYNAAAAGQIDANGNIREIAKSEMDRIAEQTITNGIAKGGIDGLETALRASVSKMGTVLQNSIEAQNKQVWSLFGVGQNYPSKTQNNTQNNTATSTSTNLFDNLFKQYGGQ